MDFSQQRLHKLEISKLKNIRDLCISFESKNITGILGPNGYGKSTIIHALACCFQPPSQVQDDYQDDYKFSNFFPPNTDALWAGSELKIFHTYRQNSTKHDSNLYEKVEEIYGKSKDRWKPIYSRRPTRQVYYFGVDSCVPLIDSEKRNVKINYSTSKVSEEIINTILKKASYCLNKIYTAYNVHTSGRKKFIGVESDGIKYSALSMSAGEQKVFRLLEKIFKAPKRSLILIDELDLLLHDSAMKNLITVMSERAEDQKLQVIFTTHRESVLELSELINVRHIFGTKEKTLCFNETKPDAIKRLTGIQPRSIEIFVEDDLAFTIIRKLSCEMGIAKHVAIEKFGAATNCFTILAGLYLKGETCETSLFVLDGDVFRTIEEKEKQLKRVLTGDTNYLKSLRNSSIEKIKYLRLPENTSPEKYIHTILIGLEDTHSDEYNEVIKVAKEIVAVDDNHKYIDDIIDRVGFDRSVGLSKIIDIVSTSKVWSEYTSDVKDWLILQKPLVQETAS